MCFSLPRTEPYLSLGWEQTVGSVCGTINQVSFNKNRKPDERQREETWGVGPYLGRGGGGKGREGNKKGREKGGREKGEGVWPKSRPLINQAATITSKVFMWLDWLIRLFFLAGCEESFLLFLSCLSCKRLQRGSVGLFYVGGVSVVVLQGFRRGGLYWGLMRIRPSFHGPTGQFQFPATLMGNRKLWAHTFLQWHKKSYKHTWRCMHADTGFFSKILTNAVLHTHRTHTTCTAGHRMWSSPLRLFARCRSMGIECGQGGLRIDWGAITEMCLLGPRRWGVCVWGGVDTSGPLILSSSLHRREVFLRMSAKARIQKHGHACALSPSKSSIWAKEENITQQPFLSPTHFWWHHLFCLCLSTLAILLCTAV